MPSYPSNKNNTLLTNSQGQNQVGERFMFADIVNFTTHSSSGFTGYVQTGSNYQSMQGDTVLTLQALGAEMSYLSRVFPNLGGYFRVLQPVGVATNANQNLTGLGLSVTIDGQPISAGNGTGVGQTSKRVLLFGQTDQTQNGVYEYDIFPLQAGIGSFNRTSDMLTSNQFVYGSLVSVGYGTNNGGLMYYLTNDTNANPVTVGVTTVSFSQYDPTLALLNSATNEQTFVQNAWEGKLVYMKKKSLRLAYWMRKFRVNLGVGAGVTSYTAQNQTTPWLDIGYSTGNDLPARGIYPSGWNRGWN